MHGSAHRRSTRVNGAAKRRGLGPVARPAILPLRIVPSAIRLPAIFERHPCPCGYGIRLALQLPSSARNTSRALPERLLPCRKVARWLPRQPPVLRLRGVGRGLQVRLRADGESIARRQLLRCDNAESDPRVNLDACRALGIASIVVLPLCGKTVRCAALRTVLRSSLCLRRAAI